MDLRFLSIFSEYVTMWSTIIGSLEAGRGWAMELHFPSVFSEDVMMKIVGSLQAGEEWVMDLRFPFVFSEDVTI